MKVEKKEAEFKPVVITLETREEVQIFYEIGNWDSKVAKVIVDDCKLNKESIKDVLYKLFESCR